MTGVAAHETARKTQSLQRIPADYAIALIKWWPPLQRFTGRRDALPDIIRAVTGLAADEQPSGDHRSKPTTISPQVVRAQQTRRQPAAFAAPASPRLQATRPPS